jgi:hypothetical protein
MWGIWNNFEAFQRLFQRKYDSLQLIGDEGHTYKQGGLSIKAMRQLLRGSFLRMGAFLKNAWHFKDILKEFEAF